MKTIITLVFAFVLATYTGIAQEFNGIATYKTDRAMKMEINDQPGVDDAMMNQLKAQLKKQFQQTYHLTFTTDESHYEQEEKLGAPSAASTGGIKIMMSGGTDILYHNLKENMYLNQTEIMGKEFLIEDTLPETEWKLEKDTKNIGEYLCFKATKTETVTDKTFNEETQKFDSYEKEKVTTVWYTPGIPVKHGPDQFYGLPGLVLEVNDGELTILCSKIVLNPKDGVNIEKPKKGKKVNQAEFNEIQEKKNKEMIEQFESDRKSKNGNTFSFQIRG